MTSHLDYQTPKLKRSILELVTLVEDSVQKAITAFQQKNLELAKKVVEGDKQIDAMEIDFEEECLKVMALYQPVAVDLRMMVSMININNLAAVPSIIFGLLGLAVILNFFGLPRSTPLVGGIVLSLMTLPTIIIACRASLKAVPPSIREGALAMGASKMQTILHHVLPLAMPGTLTGTIIGLAQALGETAPLLMIGMFAFVVDIPAGPLESATALPVQVYLWAESSERGYVELTAAGIMMILIFMALMNSFAIILRKKFERRW